MRFRTLSSPYGYAALDTRGLMLRVALALLPGAAVLGWAYGLGVYLNLIGAAGGALAAEAAVLWLRGRPLWLHLGDGSALLSGLLLGLCLPPTVSPWIAALGAAFGLVFGKQLYGGLGQNPFNPAMVGYAMLLICFPRELGQWPASAALPGVDALSGATPLDAWRSTLAAGGDPAANAPLGPWPWINLAFAAGGLYLLARRLITWHVPAGLLGGVVAAGALVAAIDPRQPDVLRQLASGGLMLGAFFIATDPVTAPAGRRAQLVYGGAIGVLIVLIRAWGGFPDGIAFSVLLLNLAAPLLDHLLSARRGAEGRS